MSRTWLSSLRKAPGLATHLPPGPPSALRRLWPSLRVDVMVGFIALMVCGKLALSARLLSGGQVFRIGVVVVALLVIFCVADYVLQGLGLIDEESPSEPTMGSPAASVRPPPPPAAAPAPAVVAAMVGAPIGGTIHGPAAATWRLEGGYVWRRNDREAV